MEILNSGTVSKLKLPIEMSYKSKYQNAKQNCQLSQFCQETPIFFSFLLACWQRPEISQIFKIQARSEKRMIQYLLYFIPLLHSDSMLHCHSLHCTQSLGTKFPDFMHCFRFFCPYVEQMASVKHGHDHYDVDLLKFRK